VIKSRRMRKTGQEARTENVHEVVVREPEGKRPLGRAGVYGRKILS
jgi:hypothetical protein